MRFSRVLISALGIALPIGVLSTVSVEAAPPQQPAHVRAKPQPFTVVSNQTVRVDMDIDTGIR